MRITVLSGGVGGSRFIAGLMAAKPSGDEVTVIGNTADDLWLWGLRVCPDLDTLMYTLGGGIDPERRWGRANETWNAKEELAAYGADRAWFGLGDRDLATHLMRTQMLRDGMGLTEITEQLCRRWNPGVRLLPMTEDEVETHIAIDGEDGLQVIHFQEYWIRLGARVPVRDVIVTGAESAVAAPGVIEAIKTADRIVLPPSNPIVSIGTILAVDEIATALRATAAPVVGVSPVINGGAVRGMADQLLTGLGIDISAGSVARHFGSRSHGGIIDGWLVDSVDAGEIPSILDAGIEARAVPLYMTDDAATTQMAREALDLAAQIDPR